MRLAHQIADALAVIAEIKCSRGGAAPAHLVEQPGQQHIVAFAQAAIVVHQELGHDKQGDAFHTRWCVRQFGQDHVHDIFRQRVVAARDEDLVATQAIGAVGSGLSTGVDIRERRAGMGFGQGHGAEEPPFDHGLQKAPLLLVAAKAFDQVGRAHGQERVGGGGSIG
ncbi:hypothetical protein D9M73_142550 [compost metagenome]